jgi:type II pantothenate kinase
VTAVTRREIGLDLGATLVKGVAVPEGATLGAFAELVVPVEDTAALRAFLADGETVRIAATGGGARRLGETLGRPVTVVDEFRAWGAGERALLPSAGFEPTAPHLLVSVGTGTSILLIDPANAPRRVGGAALGGGTLRGLARLLVGDLPQSELVALAARGVRRGTDLLVSDVYGAGEIAIDGDLTAANFGRAGSREPADLALAITRLVGENVGLLAGAIARAVAPGAEPLDVVYAGTTLRGNEPLREILAFATTLAGARPRFLPHGELTGALGALASARG